MTTIYFSLIKFLFIVVRDFLMLCRMLTGNWAKLAGSKFRMFDSFEYLNLYYAKICLILFFLSWLLVLLSEFRQVAGNSADFYWNYWNSIQKKAREVDILSRKIKLQYHVAWCDSAGAALHYWLALSQQGWILVVRCAMFAYMLNVVFWGHW